MKNKRESGEVVVEASIVVTIVVIFISIMLYIGMILYQQTAISVIANRTATNISQVYSNSLRDPFTGYIDTENAYQSITYSNMKTDAYLDAVEQKGNVFVQYRLKKAQILPTSNREVDVQIVNKPNEILKGQIVVTITDKYDIPLVGFFGVDGGLTISASGRADCVDYLDYLFGVDAIANPEESPIQALPDSDSCIVTFIKDKYSGGFHAAVPILRGKTIIESNHYTHSVMPENPLNNGMRFTGWVTADGYNFSATTTVQNDITVYGSWECTVSFDPTGGVVNLASVNVAYMSKVALPAAERSGFAFIGWFTEKNGKGVQYFSNETPIPGNITLYAHWQCLHASFNTTQLAAATCLARSHWLHECKTCDYSYEEYGSYGTCQKGETKVTTAASCTSGGYYIVNCKVCNKSLEQGGTSALGHKYAANGVDYDERYNRPATCQREGFNGSRCSRCKTENGAILPKLAHDYHARCGIDHDISANPMYLKSHNKGSGYVHTKIVQCIVCCNCGDPYNGAWDSKRTCSAGYRIASGIICMYHKDNYGESVYDGYYSYYPIKPIH